MSDSLPDPQRNRFTLIAHGELPFWNPVGAETLDTLIGSLPLNAESRILDVGCGRGELLLRAAERHGTAGVGVDAHPDAVERARKEAERRDLSSLLELRTERFDPGSFEPESFDFTACVGSTHAWSGFAETLAALRSLTRPGGHLLIGEGYWRRPPAPGYLEALGAQKNDLRTHEGNLELARGLGLELVRAHQASDEEWSDYEDTYAANVFAFLEEHPDDPEAGAMRARIMKWRRAYVRWGRATLGFGLYLFRRP